MPDPRRSSYHHGALRQALLDAARDLLAERGAAGFNLSELARRLGVSSAAPYRHFADRDALLETLAEEGYRELLAGLTQAADAASDAGDRIIRLGRAYLQSALDRPAIFEIMFQEREGRPVTVGPAAFDVLVASVAEAQEAGALPSGQSPEVMARTIWATVHGLAVLSARGGFTRLGLAAPPNQLVAESLAMFLQRSPQS